MKSAIHLDFLSAPLRARIGILGGSFDPPHLGHTLLGLSFLSLEPIDELWVIPCANHAQKSSTTDFYHRYAMTKIAFKNVNSARVLDIENNLAAPSYTIETINVILAARPDLKLFLALGSDLIPAFHTWHRAREIAEKTAIVIFERMGFPVAPVPEILASAHIHQGYALPDTNSTSLREFFSPLKKAAQKPLLDTHVLDYIKHHNLYKG